MSFRNIGKRIISGKGWFAIKTESDKKDELIKYLSIIRDTQTDKAPDEADIELIDSDVALLLDLQNKNVTLTPEEKENAVNKILGSDTTAQNQNNKKAKITAKKVLLVAAVITVLAVITATVTGANERSYADALKEKYGSVEDAPKGIVIHDKDSGDDIIVAANTRYYDTYEGLRQNENYGILVPSKFPKGVEFTEFLLDDSFGKTTITMCYKDATPSCEITVGGGIPEPARELKQVTVNGLLCYVGEFDDVGCVQIYFEHNGCAYEYAGKDKQTLLELIESLEDINDCEN